MYIDKLRITVAVCFKASAIPILFSQLHIKLSLRSLELRTLPSINHYEIFLLPDAGKYEYETGYVLVLFDNLVPKSETRGFYS